MNYIIGSGFSGLTVAYALYKKGIKSIVISPADKIQKKNSSILNLIFKNNGEIFNNSHSLTNEIKKINNSKIKDCKYIISHLDGGQSNVWGGVVGSFYDYDLKKFLVKRKEFLKNSILFKELLKIIGIKSKSFFASTKNNKFSLNEKSYQVSKKNVSNLKKFLKSKNIQFLSNYYVKKIDAKKSLIKVHDLSSKKEIEIKYQNLFLSCGPIETSKLVLNSFNKIKKITLKETRHFYAIVKLKNKIKSRFLSINLNNFKFSSQLYSLTNIMGIFFKKYFKNVNYNEKNKYFISQCYLEQDYSGLIEMSKKNNQIKVKGVENKRFKIKKFLEKLTLFNKENKFLEIKKIFFNQIGSSNHLGASIPMTNNKSLKLGVNKYGKLNNTKNIYISDSSVLNEIHTSPITVFSLNNIFRMILNNKFHKRNKNEK